MNSLPLLDMILLELRLMRYLIPVLAFTLMPSVILSVSSPSFACSRPAPTNASVVFDVQSAITLNPQPEPPGRSIKQLSNAIAINPQPLPPEKRR